MAKVKAWEVTDEFWKRVEPLIPLLQRVADQTYSRKTGGGCKPKDRRLVFEGIVYVLRTGCQWKALPAERYGSASAIHARFLEREKAGVFEALWILGLAEYDEFEGITWRWKSIDGAMMKAPLAQQSVRPNPTDRGKKWEQTPFAGRRSWRPVVARRFQADLTATDALVKPRKNAATKKSKSAGASQKTAKRGSNPDKLFFYFERSLSPNEFSAVSQTAVAKETGIPLGSMTAAIKKLIETGRVTAAPNGSLKLVQSESPVQP